MVNIYILKCKEEKYYVGRTDHTFQRFNQHLDGSGAKWTQKYPPIDLYAFHRDMRNYDETKITIQMMKKFGIENVRGGRYTKVNMTSRDIAKIERRIYGKNKWGKKRTVKKKCARCGRTSHTESSCYARYHVDGTPLRKKEKPTPEQYSLFVKSYAKQRKASLKESETKNEEEIDIQVKSEVKELEDFKNKSEDEMLAVMETYSEEENPDSFMGIIADIRYSFTGMIKDTFDTTKNIANVAKRKTINSKRKVGKLGKKIGRTMKKNLKFK